MSSEQPAISAFDAIYKRRATRSFTDERVDEATVRELLRAAVQAPTAMHLEPWAFSVIQDRELLARISDRSKARATTGVGGDHRELAREGEGRLPAVFAEPRFDIFYGASTLVVICAKPLGSFASADCWLAAENLMLAATALGLATCPIGFALLALSEPEIKATLSIPAEVTPIAPVAIGISRMSPTVRTRREPEILSWVYRR